MMFRKSRRRIVAVIMSVLVILFLGTLIVIYTSSYWEVSKRNYEMLERHAQMYVLSDYVPHGSNENLQPGWMEPLPGKEPVGKPFNSPAFELSTFYTVAFADNGQILATDIGDRKVYDESAIEEYAEDVFSNGRSKGTVDRLVYLVVPKNGYILVVFMDNTIMQESMTTLFRYTLVFGCITLVAMFFLSGYLAKKIVDPLEKNYTKQKQFISDAGHELKTPVSVVSASADILQREIGNNQWLANIQYENERMGKLIGQLLELARTENVIPQMENLDFSRLVEGEILALESMAFESGFMLKTQIKDDIAVTGNTTQLSQLVTILTDNAMQHGQRGKEIVVSLTYSHGTAVLSVINAGEPIPPDMMEQLFERFYRVDKARNNKEGHYGLGLAIAKAIADTHKGKMEVRCYDGLVEFRAVLPASDRTM